VRDLGGLPNKSIVEDFRQGYPRFCALIEAHPAFNLFRRFLKLRARVILKKQDRLSLLEQQLESIDQMESCSLFLASYRLDANAERQSVLDEIEQVLHDYGSSIILCERISNVVTDSLIERNHRILNFQNPSSRDVSSLRNWVEGNACLARAEFAYLSRKDLFSMAEQDTAIARTEAFVEDFMIQCFGSIFKVCLMFKDLNNTLKRTQRYCNEQSQDPNVYLPSGTWVGHLARVLIAVAVIVALLMPVLICNNVTGLGARIIIVSVATIVCIIALVMTVQARTIEVIVAGTT
jgi:hypothetical protein